MGEQVVNTLNTKRREIEGHIGSLEGDLEQARRDLSAILAAIKMFSADGPPVSAYMNLAKLFPRHELPKLAKAALEASPAGLSTVAIAEAVMTAKGLDTGDRPLRKAIAYKAAGHAAVGERAGARAGKQGSAVIWRTSRPTMEAPTS